MGKTAPWITLFIGLFLGLALGFTSGRALFRDATSGSAARAGATSAACVAEIGKSPATAGSPASLFSAETPPRSPPSLPAATAVSDSERGPGGGRAERSGTGSAKPVPVVARKRLDALDEASEIGRFLEEVRMDNLFEALRSSSTFEKWDDRLSQVSGRFGGSVRFPEDPSKVWDMTLDASLRIDGGKLKGPTRILLSENGKVFSNLSGEGDESDQFRGLGDGNGLLVRAAPDAYFQLYFLPRLDAFVGNYYKLVSPDRILPKGNVRLERGG